MDKRKEVIEKCLQSFITNGLFGTTSRDLSNAIDLQSGGMYYYFGSKDEAVIVCAEEATYQLENGLIMPAVQEISTPELMVERLLCRAEQLAPMMKFLVQVCSTQKYREQMEPALNRMCERYEHYAQIIAQKVNCSKEDILPYFYICITSITNYMIFGEKAYITPQIHLVKSILLNILEGDVSSAILSVVKEE